MDRILAVIDHTDRSLHLLAEMADVAAGVDAQLFVLSLLSEEEFGEHEEVMAVIERSEGAAYSHGRGEAAAKLGQQGIDEELGTIDFDEIVGAVADEGERADTILETAKKYDVDHVALVGRRRSPTGKAIFGDAAQGVILNFDGTVTIATT